MSESEEARIRTEIDRLVDDELDVAGRSRLFARLDASPGGWRECALAFLEAREWRESFKATVESMRAPPDRLVAERSRALSSLGLFRAVLTGCVVLAFGIGFGLGKYGLGDAGSRMDVVVRDEGAAHEGPAAVEPTEVDQDVPPDADVESAPVELIGLVEDTESESTVPIVSGPGFDEEWLRGLPLPLSDYDRQRLERQGYLVEQGRRLVSVQLRDGERLTIPIDLVNVRYVGERIY